MNNHSSVWRYGDFIKVSLKHCTIEDTLYQHFIKERNMKKSLLGLLMAAPLMLAACGGGNTPVEPVSSEEGSVAPSGYKYTATFKENSGFALTGVKAQWCDTTSGICKTPVEVNDKGYAEAYFEELSNYYVHVVGYNTAEWAFNPYAHIATPENRDVEIKMTYVALGDVEHTANTYMTCLQTISDVAYNITLSQDESFYLVFNNTGEQSYSIESWQSDANAAMKVEQINGYDETVIGEGVEAENGNFKYEFSHNTTDRVSSYFKITLTNNPYRSGKPYTFPFSIVEK